MLKQSQGKIDLFNDYNGDVKTLWKGENRMDDTITYKSPSFSGIQLGVTYIAEDSADDAAEDATSVAIMYGDAKLKKSKFFASAAVDSEVKGYDATRVSVQGKINALTLGAMYHSQEKVSSGEELDGFLVSAKYSFEKVTLKGQIQTADVDGGDEKSAYNVGADYKLSDKAKLFAFYTSFDMDSKEDQDYLAAGIEYSF